ncbi:MAG: hypothetical protein FJZ43_04570 [Candidatus Staskawiczbacteria bacterium]|nr:hypothetical protein [Candidatus Staskawiczbacteria bacterium]
MFDIPTEYCEQLLQIGWEPINTISNLAFVIAGIFAFYKLKNEKGVLKFVLPTLLILVGVGSSLWHFSHTHLGDIADTFFILIFASVVSLLFFRKLLHSWTAILLSFFALLGITLFAEQLDYLNGSLPYVVLLIALIVGGIFYGKKFGDSKTLLLTTVAIFGLAIIFRSIDILICPSISFGTHFLWHILVAVLGYQLILLVARK